MRVLEMRSALLGQPAPLLVCRQDKEPLFAPYRDMTADDREDALADAAAADNNDPTSEVQLARKGC